MRQDIVTNFFEETSNKLNIWAVNQLRQEGKEYQIIGTRRHQGISIINPIEKLYNKKQITDEQRKAALKFQKKYEIANIIKMSSASSFGEVKESCSVEEALLHNREIKEFVALKIKEVAELGLMYHIVLNSVILKQRSLWRIHLAYKLDYDCIIAMIIKICDILDEKK